MFPVLRNTHNVDALFRLRDDIRAERLSRRDRLIPASGIFFFFFFVPFQEQESQSPTSCCRGFPADRRAGDGFPFDFVLLFGPCVGLFTLLWRDWTETNQASGGSDDAVIVLPAGQRCHFLSLSTQALLGFLFAAVSMQGRVF